MFRQSRYVVLTYVSRKLFWLMAALYLFFAWAETQVPSRDMPLLWQSSQVRWMPRKEFDGLTAFLAWQATDEELRELRGLSIRGQYTVPAVKPELKLGPDGKPALELKLDANVTPEHLAKLAKCVRLTELHWLTVELTPEVGQTLAKLPNLQHLELTLIGRPIPSMEALPALNNLRFFQVPHVPLAELGLLARHPQLTTVELQDSLPHRPLPGELSSQPYAIWQQPSTLPEAKQIERVIIRGMTEHTKAIVEGVPFDQIPPDAFNKAVPVSAALRTAVSQLPNLKAVEIRDPWGGWPAKSIEDRGVRQALADRPDVILNPVVPNFESAMSPFLVFGTTIVLVVIGVQLLSQFCSIGARTAPAFAGPHLIVAGTLLSAHILVAGVILMSLRPVAFLPALVIATAIPAFCATAVFLISRRPSWWPMLFPIAFGGTVMIPIFGPVLLRSLGENFVQGERVGVAIAILLVECIALLAAGNSLLSLSQNLHEAGISSGLGLFQTLKQIQLQRLSQKQRVQLGIGMSLSWFDRNLEAFLASNTFTDRKRQWRAAEPSSWRSVLLMSLIGPWLLVGVFFLTTRLLAGQVTALESYAFCSVFLGTYSLTFATMILAAGSQSRRSVLGQELLRPMLRQEMEAHLRKSLWVDLWPAMITTLVYLIVLTMIHDWGPASWQPRSWEIASLGQALLCLALPIPIWAGMLLLLTIPKEFWRGLLLATGYFLLFGVLESLVLWTTFSNPTRVSVLIETANYWLAGICLLVGAVIAWWATRRLHRVEWGIHR